MPNKRVSEQEIGCGKC